MADKIISLLNKQAIYLDIIEVTIEIFDNE